MREEPFVEGEYYHIFNRGTDKREVFSDKYDVFRFIQSMEEFNNIDAGNEIFYVNKKGGPTPFEPYYKKDRLVNIVSYCLNPNHYHLILEQVSEGGISEFMKRLGGGYTCYYNERYNRSGNLFQGKFKDVHIKTNEQLLHVSAYVNLNNKVHKKFDGAKKHFIDNIPRRSSWNEYINENKNSKKGNENKGNMTEGLREICGKDIILGQFKNKQEYKKYAEETIEGIKEMRYGDNK